MFFSVVFHHLVFCQLSGFALVEWVHFLCVRMFFILTNPFFLLLFRSNPKKSRHWLLLSKMHPVFARKASTLLAFTTLLYELTTDQFMERGYLFLFSDVCSLWARVCVCADED
jgi:hypothetical protein